MKRRRLNLSLDHATYQRAESLAHRLGFRSACSMTRSMLRVLVSPGAAQTGEGAMFDGFEDFERFAEWERESDKAGNIRGRRQ